MRAWKFMERRWAQEMLHDGKVKLCTAAEMRQREDGHAARGDGRELVTRTSGEIIFAFSDESDPDYEIKKGLVQYYFGIPRNFEFADIGIVIKEVAAVPYDGLMYCFSERLDDHLISRMQTDLGAEVVVEISDLELFLNRIALPRSWWRRENHPSWRARSVEYLDLYENPPWDPLPRPYPFVKHKDYEWQREARCIWSGVNMPDDLVVTAESVKPLLRLISFDEALEVAATLPPLPPAPSPFDELIADRCRAGPWARQLLQNPGLAAEILPPHVARIWLASGDT